ncbi:CAP domain-containing protein [Desulfovibrio aminophilus]|nr:CAP domain-containing protein [Desulfovibrio aminophilus]MCM0755361.1 CAP domain-containing protein [Desulfovibrio aminophilus]
MSFRAAVLAAVLAVLATAAPSLAGGFEDELLERINAYRLERGLAALHRDSGLDRLALAHSRGMEAEGRLSHDGFDGRFARADSNHCVENVGLRLPDPTPERQFEGWRDSPGHDENLLDPDVRRAGLGRSGGYATFLGCR